MNKIMIKELIQLLEKNFLLLIKFYLKFKLKPK